MGGFTYQLFIKPGCSSCKSMLTFLSEKNAKSNIIDISTKEGFISSSYQEIMKLPTVILLDDNNKAIDRMYTIKELQEHFKNFN